MKVIAFFSILLLTACVTINIYFPAAAAEKVADEIIKDIQSEQENLSSTNDQLPMRVIDDSAQLITYQWLDRVINLMIPSAHAAGIDLSVNTAEIRQLRGKMKARFSALKSFYDKGFMGIKSDGFIASRGNIPLRDKNKVSKLIQVENADRQYLYQAIANANGHPEWFAQIRATFAARWVGNARSGWWYQSSNGSWNQK